MYHTRTVQAVLNLGRLAATSYILQNTIGRDLKQTVAEGIISTACCISEINGSIAKVKVVDDINIVRLASGEDLKELAFQVEDSQASTSLRLGRCDDAGFLGRIRGYPNGRIVTIVAVRFRLKGRLDEQKGAVQTTPALLTLANVGADAGSMTRAIVLASEKSSWIILSVGLDTEAFPDVFERTEAETFKIVGLGRKA
ncbi:hypothetical protein HYQ46_003906 [Verticillium longisporum]|nr:hypothetical protein HYQ46_003906 [Verticillium longisporum]